MKCDCNRSPAPPNSAGNRPTARTRSTACAGDAPPLAPRFGAGTTLDIAHALAECGALFLSSLVRTVSQHCETTSPLSIERGQTVKMLKNIKSKLVRSPLLVGGLSLGQKHRFNSQPYLSLVRRTTTRTIPHNLLLQEEHPPPSEFQRLSLRRALAQRQPGLLALRGRRSQQRQQRLQAWGVGSTLPLVA